MGEITSDSTAVLVSGAGGTIGSEIALALAPGRPVVVADLDLGAAEAVARRVRDAGHEAVPVRLDVTDEGSWKAAVEAIRARVGALGALVNAAGITGPIGPLAECGVEDYERVMDVNARGTFLGIRVAGAAIGAGGRIVNIASTAGLVGVVGMGAYAASKHAVVGLSRTAAAELGPRGITVNVVCPGPTEGPMIESIERGHRGREAEKVRDAFLQALPLRRYAAASEVAAAVAFLVSPGAGVVTGAVLSVDSGMTAI